jgi:hypothetical protein
MTKSAYLTAQGMAALAAAPRPAAGGSMAISCSWLADTHVIKPATRMFVDNHPSRRLWETSR